MIAFQLLQPHHHREEPSHVPPEVFPVAIFAVAWTVLIIAGLLWLAVRLISDVWLWLVGILIVAILVRIGLWAQRRHRDEWVKGGRT